MRKKKNGWRFGLATVIFVMSFGTLTVFAAPVISIQKGNPPEKIAPPCKISFSVSDPAGVASIVVNGRELGPNGGDYYEADYDTYYNSTINISATNLNGERSNKSVQITNIATAIAEPSVPRPTQAAVPAPTPAPAAAPTPTPTPAPAPTQAAVPAPTRAAKVQETMPMQIAENPPSAEPMETLPIEETMPETIEETVEETTAKDSEETEAPDGQDNHDSKKNESEAEVESALPADSYKLYPGGKKSRTVSYSLIAMCICFIGYFVVTLMLNKKRLKKYKELYDVLEKRQALKKRRNLNQMNYDEEPENRD